MDIKTKLKLSCLLEVVQISGKMFRVITRFSALKIRREKKLQEHKTQTAAAFNLRVTNRLSTYQDFHV